MDVFVPAAARRLSVHAGEMVRGGGDGDRAPDAGSLRMSESVDATSAAGHAPLPARHLPAAEPVHRRQHVLRLGVRRVFDARAVRSGRAVHRHRRRARLARRPHRADDEHHERVRPRVRFAGRRHLVRHRARRAGVRLGPGRSRARRLGGRVSLRHRGGDAAGAVQHSVADPGRQALLHRHAVARRRRAWSPRRSTRGRIRSAAIRRRSRRWPSC